MKNRIKEYREKRNLSQSQLAKELSVSRQTIIAIENDKYDPSLRLAYKLADYFDTKIENLFIFGEEKNEI